MLPLRGVLNFVKLTCNRKITNQVAIFSQNPVCTIYHCKFLSFPSNGGVRPQGRGVVYHRLVYKMDMRC